MNPVQQKAAAREFVKRWQAAEGNEDREARSFWIEFAQELLGIPNATYALDFERRVKGRKIDVFYEDMGILIENKSRGDSLDIRYERSKKVGPETPYEQAKWYADNLPYSVRPRWIITCNFDEIRIHNLDHVNPGSTFTSVTLDELPDMLYLFGFFTDKENSRIEKEKRLSVKAGELVGKLYDELSKQYQNIETDKHEQRSLNVLCVRLVFLLYAEDAELLSRRGQFYDYLKNVPSNRLRTALVELFDVLDTPEGLRDPYLDPELAAFPYINGGLFTHEDIVIPNLTDQIKVDLLAEASAGFDWKDISPTIFGAAFESTLNPETRRSGGVHFTSIESIHKVIDPLFLDDLKAELAVIEGEKVEKTRRQKLRAFQRKLSTLNFFDPAAGSHNFLTETYTSLRKLELRVIEDIQGEGQSGLDTFDNPIMVNIGQMHSIEINDFAVSVGKTALWIAEQQMMTKTQEMLPYQEFEFLPLKSITKSVCGNALTTDWNTVLPAKTCNYIISNPPYIGARIMNKEQKAEILDVFDGARNSGNVDYVAGWFMKAAKYIRGTDCRCAFVSTNSICQGEQVANVWKPLMDLGVRIDFAHKTFRWSNEATNQAHVYVIIVGFSVTSSSKPKLLFEYATPTSYFIPHVAKSINAYLSDAPNVLVWSRGKPLCDVPEMGIGNKPIDGGNYLFKPEEKTEFLKAEPAAEKYFHPWLGADEFLKNKKRYVLWLGDCTEADLMELPECRKRVEAVRQKRLSSDSAPTRKLAERPTRFHVENMPKGTSILVPRHSSENRMYIPLGFFDATSICGDANLMIPNASLYHFGVLHSQMHNAWMRTVAGRLESRYRYSAGVVYNNFPWPKPTPEEKAVIEKCAQKILDVREQYPDKSLADLYDPDNMPGDLLAAHKALDTAVEAAYGYEFNGVEEFIIAHLFKLYAEMTGV